MRKDDRILDVFRKVITSLSSIALVSENEGVAKEANNYNNDVIVQYNKYLESKSIKSTHLRYDESDIVDFSYRCIDNREKDLVFLAEDLMHGYIELKELIKDNNKL